MPSTSACFFWGGENKNKKPQTNTSFQLHSKTTMSEEALLSLRGFGSGYQCVVCRAFSNLLNSKTDAGERWEAQAVLREMNMPLCNSGSMKLQTFFFSIPKYPALLISIFHAVFPNYEIGAILLLQSVAHHRFLTVQCSCSSESMVPQVGGPFPRSQEDITLCLKSFTCWNQMTFFFLQNMSPCHRAMES